MIHPLDAWDRPHHDASASSDALVFYVAFGEYAGGGPVSASKYRTMGVPKSLGLQVFDRLRHAEYIDRFMDGWLWDRLVSDDPDLAGAVERSPKCLVLQGAIKDPATLNYLRDSIGVMTYFLDQGACAILDPQAFRWYSPESWKADLFDPVPPMPLRHVSVLYSEDEADAGLLWIHTRGMRKFGRPDISIRGVAPRFRESCIDLCKRFAEIQALGASISEGEEVRVAALPAGGVIQHCGSLDDPDFNNVHFEVVWHSGALSKE